MINFYIASCDKEGGIYRYEYDGKNIFEKQFIPLDRPMYLCVKDSKCYAVLRAPFKDNESGILSFNIDENGNSTGDSIDLSPCDYLLDDIEHWDWQKIFEEEIEVQVYE